MNSRELAAALGAELLGRFSEFVGMMNHEQRLDCAMEFKYEVDTIDSWARGETTPSPFLQFQIIRWIKRRLSN